MNGGDLIAQVLEARGVPFLFTLCGGHISPILVGSKRRGIRVIDVRHEATAVFAADAVARLTGTPGVAAVTAGPGVANCVTALKNAQLAQSPLVLLGGAPATLLRGRGALQDIDQIALVAPHVKFARSVERLRDLVPTLQRAFDATQAGVPGPAFVECPVDVLYDEHLVREWYASDLSQRPATSWRGRAVAWYVKRHLRRMFAAGDAAVSPHAPAEAAPSPVATAAVERARTHLERADRPALVVGSEALQQPRQAGAVADAVSRLGVPVFLAGMARGLLGRSHPLALLHRRREALREVDLVLLAGAPCDFRLRYGRDIGKSAILINAQRTKTDLRMNCRPTLAVRGDPGAFLRQLADSAPAARVDRWNGWLEVLRQRDYERDAEIGESAGADAGGYINPLRLCQALERAVDDAGVLVMDGGDFVATAANIVRPRAPLSFLDPGVFGTLGVGAGFALAAKLVRPDSEVWILYGDGSSAYSLAEFDTFARHDLPVIAVVGNDAAWTQIARGQTAMLGDDVGTVLRHADYHRVAEGYGGTGYVVRNESDIEGVLGRAKTSAREGRPVLVNALIGTSSFRQGSIAL